MSILLLCSSDLEPSPGVAASGARRSCPLARSREHDSAGLEAVLSIPDLEYAVGEALATFVSLVHGSARVSANTGHLWLALIIARTA